MAELIEEGYYNQLSGKEMIAQFKGGQLDHLDVNGNVLAITFPEENDSTINKVLNVESSFLAADFANNAIKYMKLWSETNATVTPLYLAKKSIFFLPAFKWYGEHRPAGPDDIFDFPQQLQLLFDAARGSANATGKSPQKPMAVPTSKIKTVDIGTAFKAEGRGQADDVTVGAPADISAPADDLSAPSAEVTGNETEE